MDLADSIFPFLFAIRRRRVLLNPSRLVFQEAACRRVAVCCEFGPVKCEQGVKWRSDGSASDGREFVVKGVVYKVSSVVSISFSSQIQVYLRIYVSVNHYECWCCSLKKKTGRNLAKCFPRRRKSRKFHSRAISSTASTRASTSRKVGTWDSRCNGRPLWAIIRY